MYVSRDEERNLSISQVIATRRIEERKRSRFPPMKMYQGPVTKGATRMTVNERREQTIVLIASGRVVTWIVSEKETKDVVVRAIDISFTQE